MRTRVRSSCTARRARRSRRSSRAGSASRSSASTAPSRRSWPGPRRSRGRAMRCSSHRRARASTCSATTRNGAGDSGSWRRRAMARNASPIVLATREDASFASAAGVLGIGWEGPALLVLTMLLLSFGLVMMYSASAVMAQTMGLADHHFVVRQAAGGAVGLVGLALVSRLDYRHLRRLAWPLLATAALLLLVVVLPGTDAIAPTVKGARRWLMIGPVAV